MMPSCFFHMPEIWRFKLAGSHVRKTPCGSSIGDNKVLVQIEQSFIGSELFEADFGRLSKVPWTVTRQQHSGKVFG